jgi:hypothetical protein
MSTILTRASTFIKRLFAAAAISLVAALPQAHAQSLNVQDLWWAGSAENGWGLTITQQADVLFVAMYIYDDAGNPTWLTASGTLDGRVFSSDAYMPTGSPFTAYDVKQFKPGSPIGKLTINFGSASNATLSYVLNGKSGTKAISRTQFGSGAATNNASGIWWAGESQNGWGVSITQQGPTYFAVWYTYDPTGKPTWFVMPGCDPGKCDPSNYTGSLYRTKSSAWMGVNYDSTKFAAAPAGEMTLAFRSNTLASMNYKVDTTNGSQSVSALQFAQSTAKSSFQQIQETVFERYCVSCHTAGHPSAVQSGLVLDAPVAYQNLMNAPVKHPMGQLHHTKQVMPGKPDESMLWSKLIAWDPAQPGMSSMAGTPMPLGSQSLSVGQLDFVKKWITAGAPQAGVVADAALLADGTAPSYAPFTALAPPSKGYQLKIDPFTVKGNFERELFVYKKVGNTQPIFVNRIELKMRSNSHHFVLYNFRADTPSLPAENMVRDLRNDDGTLNIITALSMGYHVNFGGAQTPYYSYTFQPGYALELPANAMLDLNVHYVNKTNTPLTGEAYANLHTIDASQVKTKVRTLDLSNTTLPLPPGKRTTHTKSFTFDKETNIVSLSSHMHKLGERFIIKIKGGPRDGETVYDNADWEHPKAVAFSTPITLQAGQGLTSVITYNNTTNKQVNFGLTSEEEMGIIFGYYY